MIKTGEVPGHSLSVWTAVRAIDDPSLVVVARPAEPAAAEIPVVRAVPVFADVYREHAPFVWRVLRRLGINEKR